MRDLCGLCRCSGISCRPLCPFVCSCALCMCQMWCVGSTGDDVPEDRRVGVPIHSGHAAGGAKPSGECAQSHAALRRAPNVVPHHTASRSITQHHVASCCSMLRPSLAQFVVLPQTQQVVCCTVCAPPAVIAVATASNAASREPGCWES